MVFIKRPQNSNNNTLDPCVWFDYLAWTLTTSSYTDRMCTLALALLLLECLNSPPTFPRTCGLFRRTGAFACVLKMHVKFPSHPISLQHSQSDPTFCSNALKCICIVTGCQVLSFPASLPSSLLHSLSPLFPSAFSPESFSSYLFDSPYLFFVSLSFSSFFFLFNSSIHSLLSFFLSFFASEPKIDLNGWGHGELSTLWSYGRYRLC